MNCKVESTLPDLAKSVRNVTESKLRSFLYELAEGVTNYRTVHSLTEQVQHQYHGRFAIELIQNAYDAIARDPLADDGTGRIVLRLVKDSDFSTLYVANDGLPFSESNFVSISQLGQSDKSPENSIGNKGIGFRSVLEICKQPQIWSRCSQSSERFDGYCFGFSPEYVQQLFEPIMSLIERKKTSVSRLRDIVDWDDGLLTKLHLSIHRQADEAGTSIEDWVRSQLAFLSPYLLPWPLEDQDKTCAINDLEAKGFATIVALPLKSLESEQLVARRLKEIDANSLLFLDRLTELTLSVPGETHVFSRSAARGAAGPRRYSEIKIGCLGKSRRFRTWRREIMVSDMPKDVRVAISRLPGQWPTLKKVDVTLAVGSCLSPTPGQLCIFLPTKVQSGASVNVNAPFFGDMSRTLINFGDALEKTESDAVYNDFLLSQAADLAIEAIEADLQGKFENEAADIVDLLAPNASDDLAAKRWQVHLCHAAEARNLEIKDAPWFLSDKGWKALSDASLIPLPPEPKVLTAKVLRQHAVFPAYAAGLVGRSSAIESLSDAHEIGWRPSLVDQAATVESVAFELHASGSVDWSGFWEDVQNIFEDGLSPLKERKLLLCSDGQLHAGGVSGAAIYFKPRHAGPEEEDEPSDLDIDQIPNALRQMIAILDPAVPVSEQRQGRWHNTNLHSELSKAGLVEVFRRESVLSQVLIPNLPSLPIRSLGPNADFCRDALSYGIRLVQSMQVRGEGQGAVRALAKLAAPCRGGWHRLETASFGDGWAGTHGNTVERYLKLCKTNSARAARDRILRSPEHTDWAGLGHNILDLLRDAGVHDGLRLLWISPEEWSAKFSASKQDFTLPKEPPSDVSKSAWSKVCEVALKDAHVRYNYGHYEVGDLRWIPGLEGYSEFDAASRAAFFDAVMVSAKGWQDNWKTLTIHRVEGLGDYIRIPSPLQLELANLEWVAERSVEGTWTWSAASERWYVPSHHLGRGRAWTLEHLSPLPPIMAEQLDRNEDLVAFLSALGMPVYNPDQPSNDPRLLTCLAETAEKGAYQNRDVFIGQIRTAWKAFQPTAVGDFPDRIIVQQPDGTLEAVTPTGDEPVYLPNARTTVSTLRNFALPAVTIETTDANRLAGEFAEAFASGVLNAAQIQMTPLSGRSRWAITDGVLLTEFPDLSEAIPFILTIAAFHGINARGTSATGFNSYLDCFRSAKVSVVPDLGLVPEVEDKEVAAPELQKAVWLEVENRLLLDSGWEKSVEAVADAFTQMIKREDLKFQIRMGLGEVWPGLDDNAIAHLLGKMDLSLGHYREVFELWRGDLGPAIERLSHLMWVLSFPEQSARLHKLDQRDLILMLLCEVFDSNAQAECVFDAALGAQDVFEFGRAVRDLLGSSVELQAWNRELAKTGKMELANPAATEEFTRHREASATHLRRIAATLAASDNKGPTYPELMSHIDSINCPDTLACAFWQVPFPEFLKSIAHEIRKVGFSNDICAVFEEVASPDELERKINSSSHVVGKDPLDLSKTNRKLLTTILEEFRLIAMAWHADKGGEYSADWLVGFSHDDLAHVLTTDRSLYTYHWTENTALELVAHSLPNTAPHDLHKALKAAQSSAVLSEFLGVSSKQLDSAAGELEKAKQDVDRRKHLVEVCGAEFDNSQLNLSTLFDHIAQQIDEERLTALQGFDLQVPLIPKKLDKNKPRNHRDKGKPTRAPKRQSKNMEDLIGAAGEIHAFRWLQRRYGATVVSPSNWASAYSEKAYPDNAPNVDEGLGCDISFTHDGCTYFIEVKSTDSDTTDFTLGSSEVRLARETLRSKRKKRATQVFRILRVSNALSASPTFTLLPNPYDPKYEEYFSIIEDGARVSYRP
ncbi:hypothetical protein PsAD13_04174 [Pseudovibrio sp. Ad13]|uniref:sacsin N-terminal ATP-binding-like domain-containing protein n=1 Tax=Pseudovibrio sp. Ad13 TaxID=989396 RepID=UPI0007AEC375|nr:DUF3883 domain-containing protein [Pseudovibrio sp. Ad13]KZK81225.1 hypothetical protein PsAD13_04174 [Pseudovibrio sp. Ad13]